MYFFKDVDVTIKALNSSPTFKPVFKASYKLYNTAFKQVNIYITFT